MPDADAPASSPVRGPRGLGWPLLVAGLLGALFLLAPRGPGGCGVLGRFLSDGPVSGTWEIRSFAGTRRVVVLCDPDDDRCRLVGPVGEDGRGCDGLRAVPSERAAQALVPGCHHLFFANYEVVDVQEIAAGEGLQRLLVWRPRAKGRGETARRVWIDPVAGRLLRLEDCGASGDVIREVRRVGDAPIDAPSAVVRKRAPRACFSPNPPSLGAVKREAPFAVLEPRWLPKGFGLKQAAYRRQEEGGGIAWFVYTDGLATFSLFVGPLESVRRFEGRFGDQECSHADAPPGRADGDPCETCRTRRHYDRRRTVLRVDGIHGLSVVLLGRNDLPAGDYVRILEGLEPKSR